MNIILTLLQYLKPGLNVKFYQVSCYQQTITSWEETGQNSLNCHHLNINFDTEAIACQISLSNHETHIVYVFYRPANRQPDSATNLCGFFRNIVGEEHDFTQTVNSRGNNILDVFLTNRPSPGTVKSCHTVPGISKHKVVVIQSSISSAPQQHRSRTGTRLI